MEPQNTQENTQKTTWVIIAVFLIGWTLFSYGLLWWYVDQKPEYQNLPYALRYFFVFDVLISPLALLGLIIIVWRRWHIVLVWSAFQQQMMRHTDAIDNLPLKRIGLWILLAAGLTLYTELMIIRIHSSSLQLFAYFKNVSLLSCFLGLGIGYTLGTKRPLMTPIVLPLLAVQIAILYFLRSTGLGLLLQNPISEQISFGLESVNDTAHIFLVYGFLIMSFAFNALAFIPLGHLASRLMLRQASLQAYSWNLIGSLGGIVLFTALSFAWTPPAVWFLFATLGLIPFLRGDLNSLVGSLVAALLLLAFLSQPLSPNQYDVYSPYQILTLRVLRENHHEIQVNNVFYQRVLNLSQKNLQTDESLQQWANNYELPYYFHADPQNVLIVGSGTGNDVAGALRNNVQHVDAVEIDPVILDFGRSLHAEAPYQSEQVTPIVNDARNFIRHTSKQYDLIVYGLLDSHTLLSGRSGVRLDSFVYTVEGFREARARLKEGGLISVSFALVGPELGRKLYLMLQEAFDGRSPAVYQTGYDGGHTFLIGETDINTPSNLPSTVSEASNIFTDPAVQVDKSTDDWPFFYMPIRKYPISYVVMVIILLAISLVFVLHFVPTAKSSFSTTCFFLGAGFLLIETKAITELALFYGSTWYVISIVIAVILIMAFLANLLVIKVGSPNSKITYGLLFISLIAGFFLPSIPLSFLPLWLDQLVRVVVLTIPVFFSGLAFSEQLQKYTSVDKALSANLLGAMFGGFLEYNAMFFGFRTLYIIALIMYLFAFLGAVQVRTAQRRTVQKGIG